MGLMADTTPAWREVYSTILDELAFRFTGYWAAKDWLDQIGDDPRRKQYPPEWHALIPKALIGHYDVPGVDRQRRRTVGSTDGPDRR